MGLFDRIFSRRAAQAALPNPPPSGSLGLMSYFSFGEIEKNTTAVACTNVIANSISILPLNLYFKNPTTGARQKAGWHPLYAVLKRRPNTSESPIQFFEKIIRHVLQKGNAYVFKIRNTKGEIVGLRVLNPEWIRESYEGYTVSYQYQGKTYFDADILHIPGLITDDWGHGKAAVDLAKAAVTLGNQFDTAAMASFSNGVNSKLIIDITDMTANIKSDDDAAKQARKVADYVRRNYAGTENAGNPLLLFRGMKATEINQKSNRDDELLESRKWQFLEICKVFGVPPWLIDGTYDVKYGGLEQAMTVFINFTLMPYLRHIEQKFATLLSPYEQEAYYFEFDFNVLLRPDEKSRAEFYSKLWNMGVLSANDIASKENLEPTPDAAGDVHFVPAQNMPLDMETISAYMASAKQKAADMAASPADPGLAAGSQAQ